MSYVVTRTYQGHTGGTKYYEMDFVCNTASKRALLIKRWGKNRTAGQFKVERFESNSAAAIEFNKTLESKRGRGYGEPSRHDYDHKDWHDVASEGLSSAASRYLDENPEHIDFIKGGSGMSVAVPYIDEEEIDAGPEEKETKPQLPDIPDWASW